MQKQWVVLGLLIALGALILSGCAVSNAEEPVVEPDSTPESIVDPKLARDAALDYIRAHCGRSAPPEGIAWAEENVTREGWVGGTTFRYTVETWTVTVSYPIVNPVDTIYQVTVVNEATGLRWEGEVDAAGNVTESSGEPEWFTPANARNAALAYVDGRYDTGLADLLWAESDVTPGAPDKPLVGAVKLRYTAGDWTLSLSYPVVRPDLVRYSVTIANEVTGFRWEGEVDAAGYVTETAEPPEATEATVDGWTGTIGKLPWGSQFGIYFERDDGERFGIQARGADAAVNEQIETTLWTGARVQVWGELIEGIPDVNGRQIQVERMETLSGPEEGARELACLAEASASSVLPSDRWGTYHAWSAIDGLVDSPWTEGVDGPGIGEWVMLTFPGEIEVWAVSLDVGYDRDAELFRANNRIKRATLVFSNGEQVQVSFSDTQGMQQIVLARAPGPSIRTTYVKVVIQEVYYGSRFDDTCLGEIEVLGRTR